jgi:hypothetical protein
MPIRTVRTFGLGGRELDIRSKVSGEIDGSSYLRYRNTIGTGECLFAAWHSTQTNPEETGSAHGRIISGKVYNAVYNDVADFLELDLPVKVEYGRCYVIDANGIFRKSEGFAEDGIVGIATDTYGQGVGVKGIGDKEVPISIAGFCLTFVDKVYPSGTPLTAGANGCLTELDAVTLSKRPDKLVGTFLREEKCDLAYGHIPVNGRHWIKVR